MKVKEYEMPDGRKAVFEYDENGVGKITLECMDMLMSLLKATAKPQTDCPQSAICGKPCKECGACEKECGMWEILKTEPQTDCSWKKGE